MISSETLSVDYTEASADFCRDIKASIMRNMYIIEALRSSARWS